MLHQSVFYSINKNNLLTYLLTFRRNSVPIYISRLLSRTVFIRDNSQTIYLLVLYRLVQSLVKKTLTLTFFRTLSISSLYTLLFSGLNVSR